MYDDSIIKRGGEIMRKQTKKVLSWVLAGAMAMFTAHYNVRSPYDLRRVIVTLGTVASP